MSATDDVPQVLRHFLSGHCDDFLCWLLDRAVDDPFYEVEGVRYNLAGDLTAYLNLIVPQWCRDGCLSGVGVPLRSVLRHYDRTTDRTLQPIPAPLVNFLRRVAGCPRAAGNFSFQLPPDLVDEYPDNPPECARQLLTEQRIGWLREVSEPIQVEVVAQFAAAPNYWTARAVRTEGRYLTATAYTAAVLAYRRTVDSAADTPDRTVEVVEFGSGILGGLSGGERDQLLERARRSAVTSRPYLLDLVAGAAERGDHRLMVAAVDLLLCTAEDRSLPDGVRLNACLFAQRRISASTAAQRVAWLDRTAVLVREPPFVTHVGLRTEMRRLGRL